MALERARLPRIRAHLQRERVSGLWVRGTGQRVSLPCGAFIRVSSVLGAKQQYSSSEGGIVRNARALRGQKAKSPCQWTWLERKVVDGGTRHVA